VEHVIVNGYLKMKIRTGHVSNSSSSSFILSKNSYESVFDLAKSMIPSREWDTDTELIESIEEAEIKGMDNNTSICFNSCNYETYIVKHKDYYLVSTCNNHDWNLYDECINYFPDDLKDLVDWEETPQWGTSMGSAMEDLEEAVSKLSSFWYPEYGVGGTPLSYEDPEREKYKCNDHYEDIIRIKGRKTPVCVVCYSEKKKKAVELKEKKKYTSLSLMEKVSYVEDKIIIIESSLGKRDKKRIFNTLEEVKRYICSGKDTSVKNN